MWSVLSVRRSCNIELCVAVCRSCAQDKLSDPDRLTEAAKAKMVAAIELHEAVQEPPATAYGSISGSVHNYLP